jgi:hypothetical protein
VRPEDFQDEPVQPAITVNDPASLRQYVGKVVAIVDGEVRAFGSTWSECLRAIDNAKLANPRLLFIPQGSFVG